MSNTQQGISNIQGKHSSFLFPFICWKLSIGYWIFVFSSFLHHWTFIPFVASASLFECPTLNKEYPISKGKIHFFSLFLFAVSTLLNNIEINSSVSFRSGASFSEDLINFARTMIFNQTSVSRNSFSAILSL